MDVGTLRRVEIVLQYSGGKMEGWSVERRRASLDPGSGLRRVYVSL